MKVGDRVGIPWLYSACQACEFCLSGWETLCTSQKNAGYGVPGGLGEYCVADAVNAAHIPKGLSFGQAARKSFFFHFDNDLKFNLSKLFHF